MSENELNENEELHSDSAPENTSFEVKETFIDKIKKAFTKQKLLDDGSVKTKKSLIDPVTLWMLQDKLGDVGYAIKQAFNPITNAFRQSAQRRAEAKEAKEMKEYAENSKDGITAKDIAPSQEQQPRTVYIPQAELAQKIGNTVVIAGTTIEGIEDDVSSDDAAAANNTGINKEANEPETIVGKVNPGITVGTMSVDKNEVDKDAKDKLDKELEDTTVEQENPAPTNPTNTIVAGDISLSDSQNKDSKEGIDR